MDVIAKVYNPNRKDGVTRKANVKNSIFHHECFNFHLAFVLGKREQNPVEKCVFFAFGLLSQFYLTFKPIIDTSTFFSAAIARTKIALQTKCIVSIDKIYERNIHIALR